MNIKSLLTAGLALFALISCQKEVEHYMTLSTKEIAVDAEGSTVTFDLKANVYVRVNNDCEFADIIDESVSGDLTTYTLRIAQNTTTEERSSQIRFIGDYVTPLKLVINQKRMVPTGVSPEKIEVGASATSAQFTIFGDKSWTLTCDRSDFKFNFTSGTGETLITATFPENTTEENVVATVTVTINGTAYSCVITQKGLPKKEYADLSSGGTSNCYVVSEAGYYKFKADVRGNGVCPASQSLPTAISPASVNVLWCTFNTLSAPLSNDAVISGLKLDGGYVKFQTVLSEFVEGNAVIAAYDAAGAIIWCWQIWVCDKPSDIAVDAYKFMDRNLGALSPSTYHTEDPLSCGMLYQWGRKDPFPGAGSFSNDNEVMATTGTWPEETLTDETHQGLDFTIKNPMTILYAKDKNYNNKDWFWGVQYDDLWGGGAEASTSSFTIEKTTKTMFDPCPPGYCVPTSLQHKAIATTFGLSKTSIVEFKENLYGCGVEGFWFVYPGGRLYDSGKLGGDVGKYSWYAGSCTNGVNMLCTRSHTTANNFGGAASGRTCGYSVRCVKE